MQTKRNKCQRTIDAVFNALQILFIPLLSLCSLLNNICARVYLQERVMFVVCQRTFNKDGQMWKVKRNRQECTGLKKQFLWLKRSLEHCCDACGCFSLCMKQSMKILCWMHPKTLHHNYSVSSNVYWRNSWFKMCFGENVTGVRIWFPIFQHFPVCYILAQNTESRIFLTLICDFVHFVCLTKGTIYPNPRNRCYLNMSVYHALVQ